MQMQLDALMALADAHAFKPIPEDDTDLRVLFSGMEAEAYQMRDANDDLYLLGAGPDGEIYLEFFSQRGHEEDHWWWCLISRGWRSHDDPWVTA